MVDIDYNMCLFPISASLDECNKIKFTLQGNLKLPCGKCTECISKRSIEWATRARHEISLNTQNSFITLTYDEKSLPSIFTVKTQFQKFIKKLRKHIKQPIRYMVSHEYGSKTFRPHHHAIIFGYNPEKQTFLKTTAKGEKLFTSPDITKLWQHGFHSIGQANEKTAYYIASYSLKGKKHTLADPITGELVPVADCMDVSKRPAIGYNFFTQNYQQMIDSKIILPRYYLKKLQELNPTLHEHYENDRSTTFKTRSSHELYAKYIINNQKTQINSEFRELEPNLQLETEFYSQDLLTTRDEYHLATKKESL